MVVITGNGNTSKQWKHLTMATLQTIYTIALNTLETHWQYYHYTMISLVLNDITIIEIWITNEKTRNWSTPLRLIDNGSTSWCTCIYDFPMVVFLHPSMLQYLKQTFMQYDRPLSKKYKTCSVFLLFDKERKFKNDRRC